MVKRGEGLQTIAKILRVSATTVRKWATAAGLLGADGAPRPPAPEAAPEPEALAGADETAEASLAKLIAIRDRLEKLGIAADAEGNTKAAASYFKDMAEQANNIARIKSRQGLADGALVFTKAQLEAADALISERYAALAQSPECRDRVCPRCGAEIRIAQAQEIPGAPAGHVGV